MAFPSNLIGVAASATGGAYLGYQGSQEGFSGITAMQWIIGLLLLAVGFYFAVILS